MSKKIVVAGDVTIDWLQWAIKPEEEKNPSLNWELYPGFHRIAKEGGALLLKNMIKEATNATVISHSIENMQPVEMVQSVSQLDKYENSQKESIYRVTKFIGFSGPEELSNPLPIKDDNKNVDMVILDDAGNGYRDYESSWPLALKDDKKPIIILKMCKPLFEGKLWNLLKDKYHENMVVVLNANDFRDYGANISRKLSWERTGEDFIWQITNNPEINELKKLKHLIIRFGIEGAIYYKNTPDETSAKLFYDPLAYEDSYREENNGDMQGFGGVFVASIAAKISKIGLNKIEEGIKEGIIRSQLLLEYGFGTIKSDPNYPIKDVFRDIDNNSIYGVSIPPVSENQDETFWTIMESRNDLNIESIARNYVKKGNNDDFGCIPVAKFGGLKTIDRNEIEGYQSIRNLIKEYLENEKPERPLSIAVFGPPGSGKSFGVKELAKSISKDIEKIEFNISQFNNPEDLINGLHKVRDIVLKGKIPLVFFDEFDSSFSDNKLFWVKSFLAPMQDGEFKDGESIHPIGKSLFVFAGGTSSTFHKFSREDKDENSKEIENFRNAKGTDFVSRIRGYVDILGPNPQNNKDLFYIMRRAIFLRSLLERKAVHLLDNKKHINIDSGVLRAFLMVPLYKHGVRSMEAIMDMSMLKRRKKYEQSALPSKKQLEMHVDSEIFSKLMLRDVLFNQSMEKLAIRIHENYIKDQKGNKKPNDPAMQPWDKLIKSLKKSNYQQALHIPKKLRAVQYDMMPFVKEPQELIKFTREEIEIMAEMEHERWNEERFDEGWKLGPRDPENKISPYLVHWNDLPDNIKEYDRDAVKNIPKLLASVGFEIYKLELKSEKNDLSNNSKINKKENLNVKCLIKSND